MTKKEELLKLYIEDYVYEHSAEEEGDFMPEWIHMLKDESRELRNDNYELQYEVRICIGIVCVWCVCVFLNSNSPSQLGFV